MDIVFKKSSDIVQAVDDWLVGPPISGATGDDADMVNAMVLLVDAVGEVEDLRAVLQKIAKLGENAPDGSYLEECGILAASTLMRPV